MTPADAVELITLAAAFDNRTISEVAARAWAEALDERVAPADARRIIVEHYATTREWVMPSDVNIASAAIRRDRLARMETPQPPASIDPDDPAAGIAWQRAYRRAVGDGHDEAQADVIACAVLGVTRPPAAIDARPVLALVEHETTYLYDCANQPFHHTLGLVEKTVRHYAQQGDE